MSPNKLLGVEYDIAVLRQELSPKWGIPATGQAAIETSSLA
jgi:hypothetical protein